MTHMYGQAGNTADFTRQIERDARAGLAFDKPYLLAEFGIDWQTGDEHWDQPRSGLNMHNGAWAALAQRRRGHGHALVLGRLRSSVESLSYPHARAQVRRRRRLVKCPASADRGHPRGAGGDRPETFTDLTVPATREWGKSASSAYTVLRDGTVQGGPVAMTIGSPARGNPESSSRG